MVQYSSYQEVVDAYNDAGLPNGEAADRILEHINSANVEEALAAVPNQFIMMAILRQVACSPVADNEWKSRAFLAFDGSPYSKDVRPLDAEHPFRRGVTAIREYLRGKSSDRI